MKNDRKKWKSVAVMFGIVAALITGDCAWNVRGLSKTW